jgi:NAD(P)-dependent dehydrogenase (short-subunit alcohol dehydrogenase family)
MWWWLWCLPLVSVLVSFATARLAAARARKTTQTRAGLGGFARRPWALVSGGSSGLGRCLADLLARRGCCVAIAALPEHGLHAACSELSAQFPEQSFVPVRAPAIALNLRCMPTGCLGAPAALPPPPPPPPAQDPQRRLQVPADLRTPSGVQQLIEDTSYYDMELVFLNAGYCIPSGLFAAQ